MVNSRQILIAVAGVFRFVSRDAYRLLKVSILPVVALFVGGCFFLERYSLELSRLIQTNSQRAAGRLLGLFVLGLVAFFLIHSALSIAIGRVVVGDAASSTVILKLERQEWRAFGANLRVLGLMSVWSALVFICSAVAVQFTIADVYSAWAYGTVVSLLGALAIYARLGVLIPRTVLTRRGSVVRHNWSKLAGRSSGAALACLFLSVPSIAVLLIGEAVAGWLSGSSERLAGTLTIASELRLFEGLIPVFVATMVLAYLMEVLLVTTWAMIIDLPDH